MSKNARDRRPYIRPVTRIELSESNIKLRWILIAVLLGIAVVSIAMGLAVMLKTEPGWQEVQASSSKINCSQDFVLMYDFGRGDLDATAEYKNVTSLYTQLTEQAYELFTADTTGEQSNLFDLNQKVNEVVALPQVLYEALELICRYDCRYPFLAPAAAAYGSLFLAENDLDAAMYDPARNEGQLSDLQKIADFASEPNMIRIELLDNSQARLFVSEEYLAYAREQGIETFIDFGWMKNAFIADFLADSLAEHGYTSGYLASYDGFTRNLDSMGESYSFNLFDRLENTICIPAKLSYSAPISIVSLRNYPLSDADRWHYYAYADGTITSVYLDPADGLSRSSTDNLVSYSSESSCAEILIQTAPVFIAQAFDQAAVQTLAAEGIHSIWAEENVLKYTQTDANIQLLSENGADAYRLEAAR